MAIEKDQSIPKATLTMVTESGPVVVSSDEFFQNKTVVLFGVPGAFTPTCSEKHLPGFLDNIDALKAKGVDTIACITVNDPFVVAAWVNAQQAHSLTLLADGNADYVKALGMDIDMSARGFGTRSSRFTMVIKNGVVTHTAQEIVPKDHSVTSAEAILQVLG